MDIFTHAFLPPLSGAIVSRYFPRSKLRGIEPGPNKGSFAYLFDQYGVNSNLVNGSYAIYNDPLYFVYGGYISGNALNFAGNNGDYWSSTRSSDGTYAYYLRIASSVSAYHFNGTNFHVGRSVRCVAR